MGYFGFISFKWCIVCEWNGGHFCIDNFRNNHGLWANNQQWTFPDGCRVRCEYNFTLMVNELHAVFSRLAKKTYVRLLCNFVAYFFNDLFHFRIQIAWQLSKVKAQANEIFVCCSKKKKPSRNETTMDEKKMLLLGWEQMFFLRSSLFVCNQLHTKTHSHTIVFLFSSNFFFSSAFCVPFVLYFFRLSFLSRSPFFIRRWCTAETQCTCTTLRCTAFEWCTNASKQQFVDATHYSTA